VDVNLRALNRFGLGARVGERAEIGSAPEWLRAQLAGRAEDPPAAPGLDEPAEALSALSAARVARDQDALAAARAAVADLRARETVSVFTLRVRTDRPFLERLVAFWSNHLCVSAAAGPQVAALAGHYERTVVRPHVLGSFADLVLASARHPAMLFYLDNFQSIGPGSPFATRAARRGNARGLNENYARELMELHTVGVNGGYDQADVEQLARIFTGWTVSGFGPQGLASERAGFVFRPALHEPGAKSVLGKRYGQAGVAEGEAAIRDLCSRPATANFVATKLVSHFVSDAPPAAAVESVARAYTDSDGDLRTVSESLVDLEEAWAPEHRKLRTPQDWVVAALRALGAASVPEQLPRQLAQLRHAPWAPAAPKGYGDSAGEWADPDSLMNRAELARSLPRVLGIGASLEPESLLDVVDEDDAGELPAALADASIPPRERVSLALASPAFQWR
jgi:uncharacterized protein (DUF1800 family)